MHNIEDGLDSKGTLMYSEGAVIRAIVRLAEMGAIICIGGADKNRVAYRETTFEGRRFFFERCVYWKESVKSNLYVSYLYVT